MDYLLLQILLFLILAAVVGFFIGWITRGLGFESRLLSSENQWRARHHVLQSENNRLQSELDASKMKQNESLEKVQIDDSMLSLPFSSTQERSDKDSCKTSDTEDHPLERLRSGLNQIEKSEISGQIPEQTEIFEPPVAGHTAPAGLDQPIGNADDLKTIKGIGPKIESTLNNLGIFHFHQIADFSEENIYWVNEHLQFKGRIEREGWVTQARALINEKSDT